ncbi:MAG: hypothetical protein E2579_08535 [Pseudomonas sp.]|nr:hypothetical protein [Pseudomonas sp.]WJH58007.1 hypothetical protein FE254_18430 [Pseudomonas guguanensis]
MSEVFRIRLMFEWGGGSLWCGNEAALKQFDVGPIEEILPLSLRNPHKSTPVPELAGEPRHVAIAPFW